MFVVFEKNNCQKYLIIISIRFCQFCELFNVSTVNRHWQLLTLSHASSNFEIYSAILKFQITAERGLRTTNNVTPH